MAVTFYFFWINGFVYSSKKAAKLLQELQYQSINLRSTNYKSTQETRVIKHPPVPNYCIIAYCVHYTSVIQIASLMCSKTCRGVSIICPYNLPFFSFHI